MARYLREGIRLMGLILNSLLGSDDAEGGVGPGYTFVSQSSLFTQGDGSDPAGPYALGAPGPAGAGDLLVCWAMAGPGYVGQGSVFLREGIGFQVWSPTGGISRNDVSRTVLAIHPRISTGTVNDNVSMGGVGTFPAAMIIARFSNPWPFGLNTITADNESSEIKPDASMFREDAPNNGFDHLLDVWATAKKASPGVAGATVSVDPSQPTITLIGAVNYIDNGFGDGAVAAFGYRVSPDGSPGVPVGNWGLSNLEGNDSYAVSARWKSANS